METISVDYIIILRLYVKVLRILHFPLLYLRSVNGSSNAVLCEALALPLSQNGLLVPKGNTTSVICNGNISDHVRHSWFLLYEMYI